MLCRSHLGDAAARSISRSLGLGARAYVHHTGVNGGVVKCSNQDTTRAIRESQTYYLKENGLYTYTSYICSKSPSQRCFTAVGHVAKVLTAAAKVVPWREHRRRQADATPGQTTQQLPRNTQPPVHDRSAVHAVPYTSANARASIAIRFIRLTDPHIARALLHGARTSVNVELQIDVLLQFTLQRRQTFFCSDFFVVRDNVTSRNRAFLTDLKTHEHRKCQHTKAHGPCWPCTHAPTAVIQKLPLAEPQGAAVGRARLRTCCLAQFVSPHTISARDTTGNRR